MDDTLRRMRAEREQEEREQAGSGGYAPSPYHPNSMTHNDYLDNVTLGVAEFQNRSQVLKSWSHGV